MTSTITIDVPTRFWNDHRGRDNSETAVVVKVLARSTRVVLDRDAFDDLLSDAVHYGFGGMDDMYEDDFATASALISSAKATAKRLQAAERPDEAPVVVTEDPAEIAEDAPEITAEVKATREEWLVAGVEALEREVFAPVGETLPGVKVSVGWPGGNGRKNSVIGQCWSPEVAADEVSHVFVSPVLDDAVRVLDVLTHELVHAINFATPEAAGCGHKGEFVRIAKAVGLEGKMTATVAGEDLTETLKAIAADLGPFPHGAITAGARGADGPKKQGTRMLKVICEHGSDYKVRTTRKMIDEIGLPLCPCHREPMIEAA